MIRRLSCLLVFLVVAPLFAQTPAEKTQSLAYLASLQIKGGGFRADASAKVPTLRATSAALRASKHFGGNPSRVEECKAFVKSCHDAESGGFADTPGGKPDVVLTAVGLMALVALDIPTKPYEKPAIAYMTANAKQFEEVRMAAAGLEALGKASDKNTAWIETLTKRQNPDGTFGKGKALPRDTGGAVACLLRLGGMVKDAKALTKALDAGLNPDGGFGRADAKGSDLETSYRVVRTYHMLKAKPSKAKELRRFIESCRNKDGGYGVLPGTESSAGGTYFASTILHWLDTE
jgi:prenyltransferase beta subunit